MPRKWQRAAKGKPHRSQRVALGQQLPPLGHLRRAGLLYRPGGRQGMHVIGVLAMQAVEHTVATACLSDGGRGAWRQRQ